MEDTGELRATTSMATEAANETFSPELPTVPSKTKEEGELSSSDDGDENPDNSTVQSSHAGGSGSVLLEQKGTQGIQGGLNNVQLQMTRQSTSPKSLKNNQLPHKSSSWSAHVGTDKNLVISFSDDDSGGDFGDYTHNQVVESNGNTSKLDGNTKQPNSSLGKLNKLHQNARIFHKEMPKRLILNHTFISSMNKINGSNSKGAGSLPLGQGSRARHFNPMNKNLASQDRGCDQVHDNKLQDLRQQIALRESELKLKAAQQNKESGSVLGRDHTAMKLKHHTARKYTSIYSEIAQLEPKEPDRKRLKLGTSYGATQALGSQQEVPAAKSLSLSTDSAWETCYPQERHKVDYNQKKIPLCRGESTIIRSQRQSDKYLDNSLQNLPCRLRDGADVNHGCHETEKSSRVDPCVAFNQSAMPANITSNNLQKDLEALSNGVLLNYNANVTENSSIDLQSLFGMEESIDKELEEAQEHRHKCEIEERNALKVYLKAQRSLLEANAQCTNLYHKRELCSAKLRSFILNNSSFSCSSGQHEQLDMGLDYLPRHGYVIPTSSCQKQAEYNDINHPSFDSNDQDVNNGRSNRSYHHMTGANLGSVPCGELYASVSEPLPQRGTNAGNGLYSPLDELDTSAIGNEGTSLAGHASTHLDIEYHREQNSNAKVTDVDNALNAKFSADTPQDSLLLEATLRSELFARLGARAKKSGIPCNNIEPSAEPGAENGVASKKSQLCHDVVPFSKMDDNDNKGSDGHERSINLDPVDIQSQQNIGGNSLSSNCSAGSGDQGDMPCQGHHSTNSMNVSPLIFGSAFGQLKEMLPSDSNQFQSIKKLIHDNDVGNENATCLNSDETKWSNVLAISMPVTVGNLLPEESSYSCSPAVDPFWPVCMYELRGKCNNDECPWQHVKDNSGGNIYQHQHTDSNNADCQGRLPLHRQNSDGVIKVPKSRKAILPTYLVGFDVLKADQFAYTPVVAQRNAQSWQNYFSITLATPNLLLNGLLADDPLLHGGDERIEVHGTWSKQLSSFQWRSGAVNQIERAMAGSEHAVEMALLILSQEINKLLGVKKALSILSKALESDPTSMVLWIVYLLIYYGNLKANEKDDMFLYAVKHSEGSYVLWLMYINSRRHLDDRLAAYDAALSDLCRHALAAPKDQMHESACILDLFLQMMDCLCMSGNVEKAIERSYGVFPATTKCHEPHHLLLSDIPNCLTISDRCVFWVCCVYLVIYRKLPDTVVQKFECEKDLLDIEWPYVCLSEEDKKMVVKLVETAVGSVDSWVYNESVKNEVNLKSAQLFALNHIRCMVALESLECLRNLLDKYVKLYPSCIELVLISARIQKQEIGVDSFMGFEEAITRWPKEVPGIQCIWNQYIENCIKNRRIDLAKEITVRWFNCVWQVQDLSYGGMNATEGVNSCGFLELNSKSVPDTSASDPNQVDVVFGFLNLFLYKIFQNDETEACMAVDKAWKTAIFGILEQCIRKHVMVLLFDALSFKEDGPNGAIKKILELYMDASSQAFLLPKVLTRKSVDSIKKPRVRHLIGSILSPVSFDCSLLNLILQSCYGLTLLPQTVSDQKHLVDFVEAILEVVPYNFQLALIICKLLSKGYNSSDLTSASLWFWACSTLVNAILDAIPIPPEYVWVEAGGFLLDVVGVEAISRRFYKRALSVYPFSIMLWKCFYKLCKTTGDANDVVEAAEKRGIQLD